MATRLCTDGGDAKHMSKKNNVNPGHYKVAGRERMGGDLGQQSDG
jgi:hypothetical protein